MAERERERVLDTFSCTFCIEGLARTNNVTNTKEKMQILYVCHHFVGPIGQFH